MKCIFDILPVIFLISLNFQSFFAQSPKMIDPALLTWKLFFEQSYGEDYNLINGRRYVNVYPGADGHPFLGENIFYRGNIIINNKVYREVEIKYDICDQHIILQYPYFSGNSDKIILVDKFIDGFEINGMLFRKYDFPETGPRFCQVVSQDHISCLYYWSKVLIKGLSTRSFFQYSAEKHLSYLAIENKLYPFNSRKSFLKLLPQEYNEEIKQLLRSNKIWIRDASDSQMRQIMIYCNSLIRPK